MLNPLHHMNNHEASIGISKCFVSKANQKHHVLIRISIYMEPEKLNLLMKTFGLSQFSYYPYNDDNDNKVNNNDDDNNNNNNNSNNNNNNKNKIFFETFILLNKHLILQLYTSLL